MDKGSFHRVFSSTSVNGGITTVATVGSSLLGQRIIEGLGPVFSATASHGGTIGLVAGGITGFLICASALKL
jgi:hypothetical protein